MAKVQVFFSSGLPMIQPLEWIHGKQQEQTILKQTNSVMIFFILFYYKTRCIKWKYSYENASYDVFLFS